MRQSKSAKQYEDVGIDPFSAPPAGYSLTQPEGKWPWESSPTYVTVDEAYEAILSRIKVPEERMDLLNLMDAGVPIETLVRTITFTAFSKGLMTPDVAEIVNVPLSVYLLIEAQKAGITPRFNNNTKRESIPYDDILNIMSELNNAEERLRLQLQLAKCKEFLDVRDVMMYSGYSSSTIFRRVKEGRLNADQNVPRCKLLFSKSQILIWLEGDSK